MSEGKFGFLLKCEFDSDIRRQEVTALVKKGLYAAAMRKELEIQLSWGVGPFTKCRRKP